MKTLLIIVGLIGLIILSLYIISLHPRYNPNKQTIYDIITGCNIVAVMLFMWSVYCIIC